MNESVYVIYGTHRDVYVDGTRSGRTNQLMTVETGTHTFDLGQPVVYTPASVTQLVSNTSPLAPCIIKFVEDL